MLTKYPSPKTKPTFVHYWGIYLPSIVSRENLKPAHLQQLRILCDLSVEYDELQDIIDLEGRTYLSVGRNGDQIKLRPEVDLLKKIVTEIRSYSKMLGLVLYKDTETNEEKEANEFGV